MVKERRKRCQNFGVEEKERLVKIIKKHRIILSKKNDGTTNDAKLEAWKAVTDEFNCFGSLSRTKESLYKVWEKLKYDSKVYTAKLKESFSEVSEEPPLRLCSLLEQVCAMLGQGGSKLIKKVFDDDTSRDMSLQSDESSTCTPVFIDVRDEKRKRSQNFTLEEKDRLVKIIGTHPVLYTKKCDAISNDAKVESWKEVTKEFNHCGSVCRTKKSLYKVWEKLRADSKIYSTKIRQEYIETGNAPKASELCPVLEQVCSLLGQDCTGTIAVPEGDETQDMYFHSDDSSNYIPVYVDIKEGVTDPDTESDDTVPEVNENSLQNGHNAYSIKDHCNNFNDKTDKTLESMKRKLIEDEIQFKREEYEFKRKLFKIHLDTAQAELDIRKALLQSIHDGILPPVNLNTDSDTHNTSLTSPEHRLLQKLIL